MYRAARWRHGAFRPAIDRDVAKSLEITALAEYWMIGPAHDRARLI
jgi:hypothetical protein